MKIIDIHIHTGNIAKVKSIIENSVFKDKYQLYNGINYDLFDINAYCNNYEKFFVMPLLFKETNPIESNNDMLRFSKRPNTFLIPILSPHDPEFKFFKDIKISKEHFIVHNAFCWEQRKNSYEYLNKNRIYLLIHCKDSIRIEYIKFLNEQFPLMKIIIAHMGRNMTHDAEFSKMIISYFKDNNHIYFDTSTITNKKIIKYACDTISSERVLFGSDLPYYSNKSTYIDSALDAIMKSGIKDKDIENILYNNSNYIITN